MLPWNANAPPLVSQTLRSSPSTSSGPLSRTVIFVILPYPIFCIDARKSALDLVLPILSNKSSIASTGESGLSTLRSTHTRLRSSGPISNSSLRVPLF